jgi:hypothetical protein
MVMANPRGTRARVIGWGKKGEAFFFEKKNQKTFAFLILAVAGYRLNE